MIDDKFVTGQLNLSTNLASLQFRFVISCYHNQMEMLFFSPSC